jgi:hypothetical protein
VLIKQESGWNQFGPCGHAVIMLHEMQHVADFHAPCQMAKLRYDLWIKMGVSEADAKKRARGWYEAYAYGSYGKTERVGIAISECKAYAQSFQLASAAATMVCPISEALGCPSGLSSCCSDLKRIQKEAAENMDYFCHRLPFGHHW